MRRKFIAITCTLLIALSATACAGTTSSTTTETENVNTQALFESASELSEAEKNAEKEVTTYCVNIYNDDGNIIRTYNNVFNVVVHRDGTVSLSLDKDGKEVHNFVNATMEIVEKKETVKNSDLSKP